MGGKGDSDPAFGLMGGIGGAGDVSGVGREVGTEVAGLTSLWFTALLLPCTVRPIVDLQLRLLRSQTGKSRPRGLACQTHAAALGFRDYLMVLN